MALTCYDNKNNRLTISIQNGAFVRDELQAGRRVTDNTGTTLLVPNTDGSINVFRLPARAYSGHGNFDFNSLPFYDYRGKLD